MVILWGSRLYGRVAVFARTHVATRFGHVWFFPLFPTSGSYLVLPLEGGGTGAVPVGFHGRAVLSVYLTAWGLPAALVAAAMLATKGPGPVAGAAAGALGVAGVLFGRARLATMPLDERARRVAVNDVIAFPVDPSVLPPDWGASFRARVAPAVEKGASALGLGYRVASGGEGFWRQAALHERTVDVDFLKAAFALALLEASLDGGQRGAWRALAGQIWARLRALEPDLLARAETDDVIARKPCRLVEEGQPDVLPGEAAPHDVAPAATHARGQGPTPAGGAVGPLPRPTRVPAPVPAAAYRRQGWKARGLGAALVAVGVLVLNYTAVEDAQPAAALMGAATVGAGLFLLATGSMYDRFRRTHERFTPGLLSALGAAGLAALLWRAFS